MVPVSAGRAKVPTRNPERKLRVFVWMPDPLALPATRNGECTSPKKVRPALGEAGRSQPGLGRGGVGT
jgi:hypothetical protein